MKRARAMAGTIAIFLAGTMACSPSRELPVAGGWAKNSVNVTVFRKNSLVTRGDTQFIAYYDPEGYLALGKRRLGSGRWTLHRTPYRGNVADAHNVISLMVDGEGYLHVAWDHHGSPLRYARGIAPMSLELGDEEPLTGLHERDVTYPEFFRLPGGGVIFMYRDGASGRGNLVLDSYDAARREWSQLHANLIDGEGRRSAYWQGCVDERGVIHLSWVWRETWDVATNHDLCYARSRDGGRTWENSRGEPYSLPIRAATAEYAWRVPRDSELINQTSMTTDREGTPYIATYWRDPSSPVPQYRVVWLDGTGWRARDLAFRSTPFSLKGGGTKRVPVSRPQIVAGEERGRKVFYLIFRDEERGERVSVARCNDLPGGDWVIRDLTDFPVGSWEPTYDTELWRQRGELHLFVQRVEQVDGEGRAELPPQMIYVVSLKPGRWPRAR